MKAKVKLFPTEFSNASNQTNRVYVLPGQVG